jgi:sarcosine oxidase subunit beta
MAFGTQQNPRLESKDSPLPEKAALVVVGGGVIGLSIAYNLAKRGIEDIVILEKGYLASGASGRNGGGIRQQWSTEVNIRLMQESVELCKDFAKELGVNIWFRQGGYLFLSRSAQETERLERNVKLQNRCGVPTVILTPAQARDLVPELDVSGFHAACYNPTDGILFPWPFLWGYAQGAVGRGARLFTFTTVTAIDVEKDGTYTVHTTRGSVKTPRVLDAAGAWSPEIARMVGVSLPDYPIRHEICSSEPLKPFLKPMVSVLATGLYFSQSMRGEIVGGVTLHGEPPTLNVGSRLKFLATYSKQLCALVPQFSELKILRQWAGPYDITEDGNPILGEPAGRPGFYLCCGFMGHGFMMAPVIGKIYAEWLAGGPRHEIFDRCKLDRFAAGGVEKEDFIIG